MSRSISRWRFSAGLDGLQSAVKSLAARDLRHGAVGGGCADASYEYGKTGRDRRFHEESWRLYGKSVAARSP
jgi:hypothetical protein